MQNTTIKITTARDLRDALRNYSNDTVILAQTCGNDGGAWNMMATLGIALGSVPTKLVISLRHPDLETLPEWPRGEISREKE